MNNYLFLIYTKITAIVKKIKEDLDASIAWLSVNFFIEIQGQGHAVVVERSKVTVKIWQVKDSHNYDHLHIK